VAIDITALLILLIGGGGTGYLSAFLAGRQVLKKETGNSSEPLILASPAENRFIGQELKKADFQAVSGDFTGHLLFHSIPENEPPKTAEEIPGIDKTLNNINIFLAGNPELAEQFNLEEILGQIGLESIFVPEQVKFFSNKIYDILNLAAGGEIRNFLISLHDEVGETGITSLVQEQVLENLAENLDTALEDLHIRLTGYDQEISRAIAEFLETIGLNSILEHLEEKIKEKTFHDIIGPENSEKLAAEFIGHFIAFVNTEQGNEFLQGLSKVIVELAKNIDSPLLNFLNPVLQVKMFNFLEKNIPFLAETAKEWLRINKQEIEHLIENTIDEYYSNQNMWGQLKLTIKEILDLKISEYFNIVEKGIERFENYINNHATEDLTREVVRFLENKRLGALVSELKIEPEKLSGFFSIMINEYLPKLNTTIFGPLFEKQLGDIAGLFKLDLKNMFGEKINDFLIKQIKYRFFYNPEFSGTLRDIIKNKSEGLKQGKLSDLLSREKLEEYLGLLPLFLMFSRGKLVNKLTDLLEKKIKDKKANVFFSGDLKIAIKSRLTKSLAGITSQIKEINLLFPKTAEKSYYISKPDSLRAVSEPLLIKKISQGIQKSYQKLSPGQLKNNFSELLQKERVPAALSGILTGAAAGAGLFLGNSAPENSVHFAVPVTFALIGIGSYWFSFKWLLGNRLPGAAAKIKPGFAARAGSAIEEEFNSVDAFENIAEEAKEVLTEEKFKALNYIVEENREAINEKISLILTTGAIDKARSESEKLASKITFLADFELGKIDPEVFEKYFGGALIKSEGLVNKFLSNKVENYRQQTLKSLPVKLISSINNQVALQIKNKTDELLPLVKGETLEQKMADSLQQLDTIINFDLKLGAFLALENSGSLREKIIGFLDRNIQDKIKEGIERFIQKSLLEEELAPEKDIRSLFNGELVTFMKKHMFKALDSLIFGVGLEKLKEEKENITNRIISDLRESNKDNIFYGLGESILNIDVDIREIIHLIIDTKLEPYLKDKKWELENILTGYLDFVSRKKLDDLGFTEEVLNSENIIGVIDKFLSNSNIIEGIHFLSVALLDDLSKYELGFLLKLVGITSLKDIPGKFNKEIAFLKEEIFNSISINKEKINEMAARFSADLLDQFIWSIPFGKILEDTAPEAIAESIANITSRLYKSAAFVTYGKKLGENIYAKLAAKKAGEIINVPLLQKALEETLVQSAASEKFQDALREQVRPLTLKIIENFNALADSETKEFFSGRLASSIHNAFREKSADLLAGINISKIVREEINSLPTEKLEELLGYPGRPPLTGIAASGLLGIILGLLVLMF
jgi:hypothetical protein